MSVRFLSGAVAVLALALPLTLTITLGVPSSAQAVTPVQPISALPSEIVKGTATTSTAAGEASAIRMAQVYKFMSTPEFLNALKAQKAGTATPAQLDTIKTTTARMSVPTGLGTMVKGVGGVATAYSGFTIGTSVGGTVANGITTRLWGVDSDQLVCDAAPAGSIGQGFLSFFAGSDCAALAASSAYAPSINVDAVTSPEGWLNKGQLVTLNGDGSIYWLFQFDAAPTSNKGYITGTVAAGSRSQNWGPLRAWCRKADGTVDSIRAPLTFNGSTTWESSSSNRQGRLDYDCTNNGNRAATLVGLTQDDVWSTYGGTANDYKPWPGNYGWFRKGEAWYVPGGTGDPARRVSCVIQGSDGKAYSSTGADYHESEKDWSAAVPSCKTLPPEVVPIKTSLIVSTDGGKDETVWESTTPQEVADRLAGKKYADCVNTVCQLVLEKNGTSCFSGIDCAGWFADSQSGTSTNTYTCRYGATAVAMSECSGVYRPTFEPDAQRTGQVYGDPVTGEPKPASPNPQEQAASPSKGTDAGQFGAPVLDPAQQRECFPSGWGAFNPLNWVMQPVQCALQWAFVPKPAAVTGATTSIQTALDTSGLGTLTRNASQLALVGIPGGGCGGIPLKFDLGGKAGVNVDTHILNACPGETLAPVAATTKTILSGLIVTAGFLSILRYVATIFGFSGLGGIQQQFAMSDRRAEQAAKDLAK